MSLHTLLIASWPTWWGGHGYGSRLMAEVVPILAMLLLPALQSLLNRRWGTMLISGLVILNLALHLPGSHGTAAAWNFAPADVDTHPERLWDWQHPPFLEDIQNPK